VTIEVHLWGGYGLEGLIWDVEVWFVGEDGEVKMGEKNFGAPVEVCVLFKLDPINIGGDTPPEWIRLRWSNEEGEIIGWSSSQPLDPPG